MGARQRRAATEYPGCLWACGCNACRAPVDQRGYDPLHGGVVLEEGAEERDLASEEVNIAFAGCN